MKLSDESLALLKRWEGLRLEAYQDVVGVWTIGYGHTSAAGAPSVVPGLTITEDEAEAILRRDLHKYKEAVLRTIKRPMTPGQFGAYTSLCYNIGPGAFSKSTTAKRFNAGNIEGAAEALTWWNKAGGKVVRGLVNRREDERKLFLSDLRADVEEAHPADDVTGGEAKPVHKSKTVWAGGTILGGLGAYAQAKELVPEIADYGLLILAGIAAYVVFNRIMEARAAEH